MMGVHPTIKSMADKANRLPVNAPGRYYVDDTCIECGLCREIAPQNFALDEATRFSFVQRQPDTGDEVVLVDDAVAQCPTESIGNDG